VFAKKLLSGSIPKSEMASWQTEQHSSANSSIGKGCYTLILGFLAA
jgi:hypothetical protein